MACHQDVIDELKVPTRELRRAIPDGWKGFGELHDAFDADALPDEPGCTRLDRAECLERLASTGRGRVALTVGALPVIVPVRYVVSDGSIVFPVSRDDVWRATDDHIVAFNADGVDGYQHAWSVGVLGRARHLMSDGERLVALGADRINGHRET